MHKAILHTIWKQLITLATENLSKNYWVTGPSLSSLRRRTRVLTKGLRIVDWCHRHSWCLWWRKSLPTRRRVARGFTGLRLCPQQALPIVSQTRQRKYLNIYWILMMVYTPSSWKKWNRRCVMFELYQLQSHRGIYDFVLPSSYLRHVCLPLDIHE